MMTPVRSILYVPGHKQQLVDKVTTFGADAVCLVLEDSVPTALKDDARTLVGGAIGELARTAPVHVKVNALSPADDHRDLREDLDAVVRPGLETVILPKISTVGELTDAVGLVAAAERRAGLDEGTVGVVLVIETPLGIVQTYAVASASPRVATIVCGAAAHGDLAGALGLVPSREGTERAYLLAKVLVDGRAAGLRPLDGVWTGVGDLDGLRGEAQRARALGYCGKLAIHPEQIGPIHEVFTPTEAELAHHRRVIEAFDEALAAGSAGTVVDGLFIDYAMATTARRIVELADTTDMTR